MHEKRDIFSCNKGQTCGTLCEHSKSSSIYPPMTFPMQCLVVLPSLASIVHELHEEFSKQRISALLKYIEIYESVSQYSYTPHCHGRVQVCQKSYCHCHLLHYMYMRTRSAEGCNAPLGTSHIGYTCIPGH